MNRFSENRNYLFSLKNRLTYSASFHDRKEILADFREYAFEAPEPLQTKYGTPKALLTELGYPSLIGRAGICA